MPVALKEVVETLAPDFERDTGSALATVHMLNPEVPAYVATGGAWDVAFTNPRYAAQIAEADRITPFARIPLALGVRGAAEGETTERGIARTLEAASRIAYTRDGTSGRTFQTLLERLDLAGTLANRLVPLDGGGPMRALLAGEADLAALPLSNIAPVKGVSAVAICPDDWRVHIDIACIVRDTAGETLRDWLLAPARRQRLAEMGAFA